MIVLSVELSNGESFSIHAATPPVSLGADDFAASDKVKAVMVELVRAMCSLIGVSTDLTLTLPLAVNMTATRGVVEEAQDVLSFQDALDQAPVNTDGSHAADRIADLINDGLSLSDALAQLSAQEQNDALSFFMSLKTDFERIRERE